MGYRANVVTKHREYGDVSFSDYSEFQRFLEREHNTLDIQEEVDTGCYYIEIEELEKYIATIPDNNEISNYEHMTNRELASVLRKAIKQSPDEYVTWEWF